VFQQPKQITGHVVDEQGNPLEGVTVAIRGSTIAVTTDTDGRFEISVHEDAGTLVFSIVGFETTERAIGVSTMYRVTMEASISDLDEVVVVGYGTQRRSDLTGAVASLAGNRLEMVPNLNIAQAIQGSIPGVMVQTSSAGAEPDQNIMVRGRNSILASNEPLIVVDGIPYGGSLSELNPNDVKSIEILKDASSAAIYGSRGANGVILVTTKIGSDGKALVSYDGKYAVQQYTRLPPVMNGEEFYNFKMTRYPAALTQFELELYESGNSSDWLKLALRDGSSQQHNLSVAGGFKGTKYYISGGLLDIKGLALNDQYLRASSRINVDSEI